MWMWLKKTVQESEFKWLKFYCGNILGVDFWKQDWIIQQPILLAIFMQRTPATLQVLNIYLIFLLLKSISTIPISGFVIKFILILLSLELDSSTLPRWGKVL